MISTSILLAAADGAAEEALSWLESLDLDLGYLGFLAAALLVVWILGRLAIRVLTRGLAHGATVGRRQAEKALRKAHLPFPEGGTPLEARIEEERRGQRVRTIRSVLNSAWSVLVVVVGAIMVLGELGVPVAPLLASAGILGVALGFGSQSLVKDVLSGMFMLVEDQYGVGDVVDVGEAVGVVEEVGLRTTRLRSRDGTRWYVPNGEIRRVGNMTQLWSRALIEVRFAFDTDPDEARQALLDSVERAQADEAVAAAILDSPEVPGVEGLEFNAVTMRLLIKVSPSTQWLVRRAVFKAIKEILPERGIRLAAPEGSLIQSDSSAHPSPPPTAAQKPAPRNRKGS